MAPSRIDDENGAGTAAAELTSKWPDTYDLRGSNLPCRLEGEVADLVVLGTVPPEIDGTFYRVSSSRVYERAAEHSLCPGVDV